MELRELIEKLPERERIIISGVEDSTFQPVDESVIQKAIAESNRINEILNARSGDVQKEKYFGSVEEALDDSYAFLSHEYDVRDGDPIREQEYFARAKNWGSGFAEQCKTKAPIEVEQCKTPLTEDEVSGKQRCSGVRVLMRRAVKECNQPNFEDFLKGLGMSSAEEFIEFKNMYVANVVSQLVGGFVKLEKGTQEIRCSKDATIVIGLPSAGKSTTISQLKAQFFSFHIDADAVKALIAQTFGVSINAPGMHQMSSYIRDELVAEAKKQGVNLIVEKIGESRGKIEREGQGLADEGYTVGLSLVHVNNRKSRMGNAGRCLGACKKAEAQLNEGVPISKIKPPRMVSDAAIIEQGNGPFTTYLELYFDRHSETSPFKGKFHACDNEVEFRGERDTAEPIVLYGITDADAAGCTIEAKKQADVGFKRIKAVTERSVAESIYGDLKKEKITPEQEKYLASIISPNISEGQSPEDSEPQKTQRKCKEFMAKVDAGEVLSETDLELLVTYIEVETAIRSIIRSIYNPEMANIKGDLRTDLERDGVNEYIIISVVKNLFREKERQAYIQKVKEDVRKRQEINKTRVGGKSTPADGEAELEEGNQPS